MNQFRHPRLSVKLGLVVLAIVAGALGIVYAAVVPRLEDRLVANKIDELERNASLVAAGFRGTPSTFNYDDTAALFQASLGARVVVFKPLAQGTLQTIADSNPVSSQDVSNDPIPWHRSAHQKVVVAAVAVPHKIRVVFVEPHFPLGRYFPVSASNALGQNPFAGFVLGDELA